VKAQSHWNEVYETADVERLGWHEAAPVHSLAMIDRCEPDAGDVILDVGSGASTLVPALLARGHEKIVAVDISTHALRHAQSRLSPDRARRVTWIVDDILDPRHLDFLHGGVDVWHDRALFHFLTHEAERQRYVDTLRHVVVDGGHLIIAAFSLRGADRCSGLPVQRYNADLLGEALGSDFELLHSFECLYVMPSGHERPYVYTLFERSAGPES
jgi:SAM-dependent methyltransferase